MPVSIVETLIGCRGTGRGVHDGTGKQSKERDRCSEIVFLFHPSTIVKVVGWDFVDPIA